MRITLIGQPNCGKSTLFNSAAGYRAVVSNFPGTTIEYTKSKVNVGGDHFELVDLPGIYSLSSPEKEELLARNYLLKEKPDGIINIVDSSVLSRSLELTLELLDFGIPLVLCLNMIDEATQKGIQIDFDHLAGDLGVPVVPTIAARGKGVPELFKTAIQTASNQRRGKILPLSPVVESAVEQLAAQLKDTAQQLDLAPRLLALKLLEEDEQFAQQVRRSQAVLMPKIEMLRRQITEQGHRPSDMVISSSRHSLAMDLFEHVAKVTPRIRRPLRERVDNFIMHPYFGYLILAAILFLFFTLVFGLGRHLEEPLLQGFGHLQAYLLGHLEQGSLFAIILKGMIQGLSGGIGIVFPYLIPFLLGLSLLEDIGYLPRAAFLMDSIMHRIGLHGKSIIPFVLGYGCNVPSIMAVQALAKTRDRFITSVLATLIPCAARTTIIFALVGFYLGPAKAILLYLLNLVVIGAAGKILSKTMPEISPGLVLEIPAYRAPNLTAVSNKIWFRLREFIVIAWPLLIMGSLLLSLLEYFQLSSYLNSFFAPFTSGLLGLPREASVTLLFGILRKELTIIMLVQALGTNDFAAVMTPGQMMTFTVFTLFYVPCLATLGVLRSVLGNRGMVFTLFFNTAIGTMMALAFRALYIVL